MNALGVIFSNIHDNNLPELTSVRTMGSVPFCGRYRLVDFPLSNMVNSGINKVGIITKSNFQSLMDHVGSGKDWDLARRNGGLMLLPPFGDVGTRVYSTRLEALTGAINFLTRSNEEYVFMSDSDMVCSIDFNNVMKFHLENEADITMIYAERTNKFINGSNNIILTTNDNNRVTGMSFDPRIQGQVKLYTNIMLIKRTLLINLVTTAIAHGLKHFSEQVLAAHVESLKIFAYKYSGYLSVINSLQTYYDTSMEMLNKENRDAVFKKREIFTKVKDSSPTKYGANAVVKNSLISEGCDIQGEVYNSIIFRGVKVGRGTVVKNSILMQNTLTGENVSLNAIIADKNVVIRDGRVLSGCETHPFYILKNSVI